MASESGRRVSFPVSLLTNSELLGLLLNISSHRSLINEGAREIMPTW